MKRAIADNVNKHFTFPKSTKQGELEGSVCIYTSAPLLDLRLQLSRSDVVYAGTDGLSLHVFQSALARGRA